MSESTAVRRLMANIERRSLDVKRILTFVKTQLKLNRFRERANIGTAT